MKTCALYGFIMTLASAFVTLVLFFLGYHSDASKMGIANGVGSGFGLAIAVACTVLGIRARRTEVPESEPFGYGSALWAGVLITVVASVLGAVFSYLYMSFINPSFSDVLLQFQMDKLQAKGISGAQFDQAEKFTKLFTNPGVASVTQLFFGLFMGLILSLIIAAFLKRSAPSVPPVQA
jgi:hypothetical protein